MPRTRLPGPDLRRLSRRERQIMDILYAQGPSAASQVRAAMSDAPSYSAVRAQLRILEGKGVVSHVEQGPRYIYQPVLPPDQARLQSVLHLVETHFGGSVSAAAAFLADIQSQSPEKGGAGLRDRLEHSAS